MIVEFKPLDHTLEIIDHLEDIEFRANRLARPLDPRIEPMPRLVGRVILESFEGDVDEAKYAAARLCNTRSNPPLWAQFLSI